MNLVLDRIFHSLIDTAPSDQYGVRQHFNRSGLLLREESVTNK